MLKVAPSLRFAYKIRQNSTFELKD